MSYLLYVSHDAENLRFYLWLQDYINRFFAASLDKNGLSRRDQLRNVALSESRCSQKT